MPDNPQDEPQFGIDGCTCIPFTRQTDPPRYLSRPTDTVDMISGWERGRDCPHHAPAVSPPPDQTALRDRLAEAMAKRDGHPWPTEFEDDERDYCRRADAALAVLPPAADRAAAALWAADFAEETAEKLRAHHEFERANGALDVMTELRRLAAEAQQQGDVERRVYAWAQTIDTADGGHAVCIPGVHHSGNGPETTAVIVSREDVPVLAAMLAEAPQPELDDTDLTETDIDRMMAAGVPVQIVTAPPSTRGAEAPQPDTEARCSCGGWFLIHHLHADDHQPAVPVQPAADGAGEEAGAPPVCEGFVWIGQSFATCERCDQPAWEHAGEEVPVEGSGPFDNQRTVRPWAQGQADRIRAKWGTPTKEA